MIPDDVLERAAEAMYRSHPLIVKSGADEWDNLPQANRENWTGMVRAALPVLIPAIRADLVREMMEQTHSWIIIKDDERGELMDSWLADFLPATEEDKP